MRDIGFGLNKPDKECQDDKCPFHGSLKCRGKTFSGTVVSSKMQKTVNVEWEWKGYLKKYERYEKKRSRVKAHNPQCINAGEGNIVRIIECRPLSKTKNFVVVEILGKERGFKQRIEAEEESKVKKEAKKDKSLDNEKAADEENQA